MCDGRGGGRQTKSREQRAESKEQRAKSRKTGDRSREKEKIKIPINKSQNPISLWFSV
jgi:hypothetical protein